ncbi:MAG: bifunctional 5,10-methylene-tetrahydrofolate dehydrogenase/5,10-methylene-tetrahydrofolate cyclohydrolase [Gemmatimonadaceae bacterium]|nr:bifunctional 5,10-methylene-tetrahydrofolate dehydrogenase/5,10-methylene-tetrahydrofolate cyclohydrolase [Gemmatimonadaceae bacterium]
MPAELLDGIAVGRAIRDEVAAGVLVQTARGVVPGLAVVLVGEDPASTVYVRNKGRACEEAGMHSVTIRLPGTATQADLLAVVDQLNADPAIHGMLVQMPLPPQCDAQAVIRRIDPAKDVDGFHPINAGKLIIGETDGFAPCTPAGVIELLKRYEVPTAGAEVVIIGRSNIVGKPMASLLVQPGVDATVTICHSRTRDLPAHTRRADILVAAIGRPKFVTAAMVKPGATVIDVGINRVDEPRAKHGYILAGDVDFAAVREVAGRLTPVPGGVGPLTIAMLLKSTLVAASRVPAA